MRPYIVAEINTSHFGSVATAQELIRLAKEAGCDCVKFQSWTANSLYCSDYYEKNKVARRLIESFALNEQSLRKLALFASDVGIDFASTPYTINEAQFLVEECNVPFIKIASMELDNLPYLSQLGEIGIPLILSTGMGTSDEIIRAVETIQVAGNSDLIILHCTSLYPAAPTDIRLRNIESLRMDFPDIPIGYSDHSLGVEIPTASIALGACLVEKHFSADIKRIGMDNQMAIEPRDMQTLVQACHIVYESLGGAARILSVAEQDQRNRMRRSVVSRVTLTVGSRLTRNDIEYKRPGTGLSPSHAEDFIGCRVTREVPPGVVLERAFFEN